MEKRNLHACNHCLARTLGCDAMVTGHYARIEAGNGRWLLKKEWDEKKARAMSCIS